MQIRQKGLSVAINTFTGEVTLRYIFPIKAQYTPEFQEVAQAYNISVEAYMGRKSYNTRCIYTITATSDIAFQTFRIVQRELMLLSRQCKVQTLQQEIDSLKQ